MKKLTSIILLLLLVLTASACDNAAAMNKSDEDTAAVTSTASSSSQENNDSAPREKGTLRVDGVTITSKAVSYEGEALPFAKAFLQQSGKYAGFYNYTGSEYYSYNGGNQRLIINDYSVLKSFFETNVKKDINAEEVFAEDILEDNFVVAIRGKESNSKLPFFWFDCKFSEETNELTITPVSKKGIGLSFSYPNILLADLYMVVVPKAILPQNHDLKSLNTVIEEDVTLDNSQNKDVLSTRGSVVVALRLNIEDGFEGIYKKYRESSSDKYSSETYNKAKEEMLKTNKEYAEKIALDAENVIFSEVSQYIYVCFDSVAEYLEYESYFKALEISEFVEKIYIT